MAASMLVFAAPINDGFL